MMEGRLLYPCSYLVPDIFPVDPIDFSLSRTGISKNLQYKRKIMI